MTSCIRRNAWFLLLRQSRSSCVDASGAAVCSRCSRVECGHHLSPPGSGSHLLGTRRLSSTKLRILLEMTPENVSIFSVCVGRQRIHVVRQSTVTPARKSHISCVIPRSCLFERIAWFDSGYMFCVSLVAFERVFTHIFKEVVDPRILKSMLILSLALERCAQMMLQLLGRGGCKGWKSEH